MDATEDIKTEAPRSVVFVDRDNTLIEDPGYISDPDQVVLLAGTAKAIARLRDGGYPVVVVTNQSGIARGLLTEVTLVQIHQRMQSLLQADGADVDAIYYCPYFDGPEAVVEAYRRDSDLRKPKPGLFHMAAREMNIDLASSWMVGDSERDIEAGQAAGCKTVLISQKAGKDGATAAEYVVADLLSATDVVLGDKANTDDCVISSFGPVETASDDSSKACEATADEPAAETAPNSMCPAGGGDNAEGAEMGEWDDGIPSVAPSSTTGETPMPPPTTGEAPTPPATQKQEGNTAGLLGQILDEIRIVRRGQQHEDFSIGRLAGAIAQAVAICAVGWAFFAAADDSAQSATQVTIRLLAGIAFQLMALTFFVASKQK